MSKQNLRNIFMCWRFCVFKFLWWLRDSSSSCRDGFCFRCVHIFLIVLICCLCLGPLPSDSRMSEVLQMVRIFSETLVPISAFGTITLDRRFIRIICSFLCHFYGWSLGFLSDKKDGIFLKFSVYLL